MRQKKKHYLTSQQRINAHYINKKTLVNIY